MIERRISTLLILEIILGFTFPAISLSINNNINTAFSMENLESNDAYIFSNGTYFEIIGSVYLNISLTSSEQICLFLQSIPKVINFQIESINSATSTQITLSGLLPDTIYYRYEGIYLIENFTTSTEGIYSYIQDITQIHNVMIKEVESTIIIDSDHVEGTDAFEKQGDTWVLTRDLYERGPIYVIADYITIDGHGHRIEGNGMDIGLLFMMAHRVTLQNFVIENYHVMIQLSEFSEDNIIRGNTFGSMYHPGGFCIEILSGSKGNEIYHNNIFGFYGYEALDENPTYRNLWFNQYFFQGNYWDWYRGEDRNNDGIGDTLVPYPNPPDDYFPYISPNGWILEGPYGGNEGTSIFLDASTPYDYIDPIYPLSYVWDFNGDGRWDTDTSEPTINHIWSDDFVGYVKVGVNDGTTLREDTAFVRIGNVCPSVDLGPDLNVYVNDLIVFSPTITDPGADTFTYTWNFDNGIIIDNNPLNPTISYDTPGTYTVRLDVVDDDGGSGSDTLIVTVNAVNNPPEAVDDKAMTNEDTAVSIDVMANDTDLDGDFLSIVQVTDVTSGIATMNPDGTITYIPNVNYFGLGSFTYMVTDGMGGFDTAFVNITIHSVNDAPIAVDDTATIDEDTAVSIDVLANDTDVEGDFLTIDSVEPPYHGTASISMGMIIYTPNEGFAGTDSFEYIIIDGQGGSDTAVCTVNVLDKTPPDTTHSLEGTLGEKGWYISNVNVTLSATDTYSGISYTEYRINDGSWVVYTGEFEIANEGLITLHYRSVDGMGNVEDENENEVIIKIDKTAPIISISLSGTEGENGWYVSDVIATPTYTELTSGLKYLECNINGTGWFNSTESITIPVEGVITFYYRSADIAGNIFPETIITIKIDKTAPKTELIVIDGFTDEDETLYVTYNSTFVVIGLDNHSGVKQSLYRINACEWFEFFEPFNLTGDFGEFIIEYYSIDLAGNVESIKLTVVILKPEFEESYQGFGILRVDGQKFIGFASLSISEDTIQMEVEDQIATWDIVFNVEFRNIEIYTGEGELGRIIVIVFSCGSSTYVVAFGNGVSFFGGT